MSIEGSVLPERVLWVYTVGSDVTDALKPGRKFFEVSEMHFVE
jgi:hypothetical protein